MQSLPPGVEEIVDNISDDSFETDPKDPIDIDILEDDNQDPIQNVQPLQQIIIPPQPGPTPTTRSFQDPAIYPDEAEDLEVLSYTWNFLDKR